jgi:hypothetical protein
MCNVWTQNRFQALLPGGDNSWVAGHAGVWVSAGFLLTQAQISIRMSLSPYMLDAIVFSAAYRLQVLARLWVAF